jgi:Ca2+/Na+ antiporter
MAVGDAPTMTIVLVPGNCIFLKKIKILKFQILGVTIIAWANSIGDFVADTTVARKGFPRMGISAVIGGPLYSKKEKFRIIFKKFDF